jgi:hypothetical protein
VRSHHALARPRIDRAMRCTLAAEHTRLLRGGDAQFDPTQLAETRSIVDGKHARMRSLGAAR